MVSSSPATACFLVVETTKKKRSALADAPWWVERSISADQNDEANFR
jgi:hypothetical protein